MGYGLPRWSPSEPMAAPWEPMEAPWGARGSHQGQKYIHKLLIHRHRVAATHIFHNLGAHVEPILDLPRPLKSSLEAWRSDRLLKRGMSAYGDMVSYGECGEHVGTLRVWV